MSQLLKLNLYAQELPSVVPSHIAKLQKIFPGKELIRNLYFNLTYKSNLGWKHSCVRPAAALKKCEIVDANLCFVTITKNPYSWLLSLHRRPYHQRDAKELDFETFLKTPWDTVTRDNTKRTLRNPIELWNIKNSSYLQLAELNTLNITTESIFEDPKAIIDSISDQFSISKLSDDFVNFEQSTKDDSKDSNYYRDYYLNEKWRDQLSREAISIINKSLNKTTMDAFGYKVIL